MKLLECVANVSEGQDRTKIEAFAQVIEAVPGVALLHQDPGYAAHRTVFTFAGPPEAVCEAAFKLYALALEKIDMRNHHGTHPRQGAVDVCPLVPLQGMDLAEADYWAKHLAKRITEELQLGGYFYEFSAPAHSSPDLAFYRKGSYEKRKEKIAQHPLHFGSEQNIDPFGLTVIGARPLMIAYNINLASKSLVLARELATLIRASGSKDKPGLLRGVKAIGWYIEDFDRCQVSFNLTRLEQNGLLEVYRLCEELASKRGEKLAGSELVGLIPLGELQKVAQHYFPATKKISEQVSLASQRLGLSSVKDFDPQKQIIEWNLAQHGIGVTDRST